MNDRLEVGLMAGAVVACTASCATLLAIALQPEQILQPLSISLGLPTIEAVEVNTSPVVELTPLSISTLDLTHLAALTAPEADKSQLAVSSYQLTFSAEPVTTQNKGCAVSYQFKAPTSWVDCALALPATPFRENAFQFSPLLTALETPTTSPQQTLFEPVYQ